MFLSLFVWLIKYFRFYNFISLKIQLIVIFTPLNRNILTKTHNFYKNEQKSVKKIQ